MLADSKKISIRQAIFLVLTIVYASSMHIIPIYVAKKARQTAWLSPFFAVVMFFLLTLVWHGLYKKYNDYSLMDIYTDICGSFIGKILTLVYLLWCIILTGVFLRNFGFRIIGSILPNVNVNIFLISMLLTVVYVFQYGLINLARMNEIILPLLTAIFFLAAFMLLPEVKLEFLTPITYRSILPAINGSIGIMGIVSFFSFIFIFGNKINNKESIKKIGLRVSLIFLISFIFLIVITVGTLNFTIVRRIPLPFFMAVKEISLFNILEKVESIVISLWVMGDFVIISFFAACTIAIMKHFFKFSNEKPLFGICAVMIYFLSLSMVSNLFELEKFLSYFIIPGNILLGFIIPIVIYGIGKIRNKIQ